MMRGLRGLSFVAALCFYAQPLRAADEALVLGIFPRYKATETTTMFKPLADHLSQRLGRQVTVVTSKDFESFWHGVNVQKYDIVHYNQYHYIRSARAYRVIAHQQEFGKAAVSGALFVRKDSGIKSIGDLKGKRMTAGFTAQHTILPQLSAIYATAGMTRFDVVKVQVPSVVAGANAFMSGQTDGFIFAHGAGKVREADAAVGGIRALPIANTPENEAAIKKYWPTGFLVHMTPGPANPGVLEPGYFIAYPMMIFTNKKVPDDAVEKLAKVIYESKPEMAQVFAPMKGFEPKKDMVGETAPGQYHPGAIKFYKEVGLWKDHK